MKKIFISYSARDKKIVSKIASHLKEHCENIWFDEWAMGYGDGLVKRLSQAIDEVDCVLAFISVNSINSSWVRYELELAMTGELSGKKVKVIPIVLDCSEVPFFLAHKLYCDLSQINYSHKNLNKLISELKGDDEHLEKTGKESLFEIPYENFNTEYSFGHVFIYATVFASLVGAYFFHQTPNLLVASYYAFFLILIVTLHRVLNVQKHRLLFMIQKASPNIAKELNFIEVFNYFSLGYIRVLLRNIGRKSIKGIVVLELFNLMFRVATLLCMARVLLEVLKSVSGKL